MEEKIESILNRLFTNGQGEIATRLQLKRKMTKAEIGYRSDAPRETEADLGGWNKDAVKRILQEELS